MNFFRFDHPELLWLLLLGVPIVWLGRRSLAQLEPVRRWTAIGLRLAVLLLLVLMLAGLQAVRTHSDLTVIAVVDQSESVRRFARTPTPPDAEQPASFEAWIGSWLRQATRDRRTDDRFGMVTFDGQATVRSMPTDVVSLDPGTIEQPREGTDIASGIRSSMAIFSPDSGRRMVLVSDGNSTEEAGDVLAAAREAAAAGVPIDVLPVDYRVGDEVMVEGLYAPTEAREGQTVALRVVLRATRPSEGQLQLLQDEQPVDLNGDRPGTGAPIAASDWTLESESEPLEGGVSSVEGEDASPPSTSPAAGRYIAVKQIDLPMHQSGASRFVAVFEPRSGAAGGSIGDTMSINNRAEAFTLVQGRGRVLFVDNLGGAGTSGSESGAILPQALASHGIELDVVPPSGLPSSLTQLQKYDAVLFQNVPADLVTLPQQRMLARYVNNLGGGFVMIGGPDSFGAGGWTHTPIDQILPVDCEIPSQTILPSGALVIVLDRSGSMSSTVMGSSKTQMELASEAAVLAVSSLYAQDIVGVVGFDYAAQWVVPLRYNDDPGSTASAIRSIQSDGGTNVYAGMELAYQELAQLDVADAAIKHVILLTDGQSTEPEPGGYVKLVGQMMRANITLSTVGVGDGHDGALLARLAQMGGGQYHPVTNPNALPQVFIKEAKTIRKNLIKEQPFEPQLVQTGSPVMNNVSGVPPLRGLVLTGEKRDPRVFMPILGAEGEPVFAHWQVGLGRTAAFTSDATNRWATPWLQWPGYADFWARTVRHIARPTNSRDIDLLATIDGDRLRLRLDAAEAEPASAGGQRGGRAASSFGNFLRVRGSVLTPDGETVPVELEQVGPGVYETQTPADATGNYIVSLFVDDASGGESERRVVFSGASRPPGEELRRFESNLPLLRQVAEITGGRFLDPTVTPDGGLYTRDIAFESRSVRPLWRTLLVWLVVLVLLDVACRRIAWDPVAIYGWARERTRAIGESMKGRDVQGETTLAALQDRRAQTRERLDRGPSAAAPATAPAPLEKPQTAAKRKFEASETFTPDRDFAAAVGGASKTDNGESRPAKPQAAEETHEEPGTTSRLLAAKRRAREQLTDE